MSEFEGTAPGRSGANTPEYTVSELSNRLKRTVEDAFGHVRVRGEIAGFKRATSGHAYFRLKDQDAVIDAVCWKGTMSRLTLKPEDGIEVICSGKLTTYPGRSSYQIVVERMELAGVGALMAMLEMRKKKLAAEGLFDASRKRAIPFLPDVIGVVTSPTGAVIRDILHRLRERFPRRVLVWPVLVQGEGAAAQVAAAIEGFNRLDPGGILPRPDLIIVARGGGSLEDLMAFNEEIVVRAAAASQIPLISAVGHETDTTLIDFASDRRAPTPTAAAEIAVPVRLDIAARLGELGQRQDNGLKRLIAEKRQALDGLRRGLRSPRDILQLRAQQLDELGERLPRALRANIEKRRASLIAISGGLRPAVLRREVRDLRQQLERSAVLLQREGRRRIGDARSMLNAQAKLLESLSYRSVLARGYAVIREEAGNPLTLAANANAGSRIEIEFSDGRVGALLGGSGDGAEQPKPKKHEVKKPASGGSGQGSLL